MVAAAIDTLRKLASDPSAPLSVDDYYLTALLYAEPASLRNPGEATRLAESLVQQTHHGKPMYLLELAHAYYAQGRLADTKAAAEQGLALLAPVPAGRPTPEIRKNLEQLLAIE